MEPKTQNPTPNTRPLAIGERIAGRWEICQILRGGMGVVYIVYDHEHRLPYAAKTFRDDKHSDNSDTAAAFLKEAHTWVELDAHANVARAEFVQTIMGKPFLFLEYVSGGDLTGWIGTPRLTEDLPQVLRFAVQFCDGMIHAAAKGISVHRDIKPHNCLVTEDGILKITDFGLAKAFTDTNESRRNERRAAAAPDEDESETRTGTGAGTSTYMAPEQFDDVKQVDVRADVYSFGVVLFQMLTGQLPFDGDDWEELKRRHQTEAPPPLPRSLPPRLVATVATCLSKNPAARFADFTVLHAELAAIYQERTGMPAPPRSAGAELDAVAWSNKGASLSHLHRPAEALACYERALESNPRLKEAWNNKGLVLRDLARYPEATACFDQALALDPSFASAWSNKGGMSSLSGRHDEALACYQRALDLNPTLKEAWIHKGALLKTLRRHAEAVTCYDGALALEPDNAELWFHKAESLQALARHPEALACYDRALALDPGKAEGWSRKGKLLQAVGRHPEALASYRQAFSLDPNVVPGRFTRWAARTLMSCAWLLQSAKRKEQGGVGC